MTVCLIIVSILSVTEYIKSVRLKRFIDFYSRQKEFYIDYKTFKELQSTQKNQKYLLIDSRSSQEYAESHITKAVNIPIYMNKDLVNSSRVDKNQWLKSLKEAVKGKNEIFIYSYSIQAKPLVETVELLLRQGYLVKILDFNEWKIDNYQSVPMLPGVLFQPPGIIPVP